MSTDRDLPGPGSRRPRRAAVEAPLRLGDQGPPVAALIAALLRLIDRGDIALPESSELAGSAGSELAGVTFGPATAELVRLFRIQHGLGNGDDVDEPTAALLTELETALVLRDVGQ